MSGFQLGILSVLAWLTLELSALHFKLYIHDEYKTCYGSGTTFTFILSFCSFILSSAGLVAINSFFIVSNNIYGFSLNISLLLILVIMPSTAAIFLPKTANRLNQVLVRPLSELLIAIDDGIVGKTIRGKLVRFDTFLSDLGRKKSPS